jgi:hypothetical protein
MPEPADAAAPLPDAPPGVHGRYAYANYFEAGFSHEEILLRFAQAYDGLAVHDEHARIVMTPRHAHALLQLLQGTLARFEAVRQATQRGRDVDPDNEPS